MASIEGPRRVVRPHRTERTAEPERRAAGTRPAAVPDRYRPRSKETLRAVRRLDAGLDDAARAELAAWLREEYAGAHGSALLGFVAVCHLGPPYVDHRLNLLHAIVDHYGPAEPMPTPFDAARMTARSGAYAYVEVYDDGLILPVHDDGAVVRRRGSGGGAWL